MSKHSFTDKDGDTYTVKCDSTSTLLVIELNDGGWDGQDFLTIRVDAAEDIARIILEAAKEARA